MGYPLYDNRDSLCADVTIFNFNAVCTRAVTINWDRTYMVTF